MINEQQERVEMLLAMMSAITDIPQKEAQKLLSSTVVYENILAGNECALYESPSASLLGVVEELREKGAVPPAIRKITPEAIVALNCWMEDNQIYEAADFFEKLYKQKAFISNKECAINLIRAQFQNLSNELREKIEVWLLGTQNFTEHLFSQWAGDLGVCTSAMAGTRGGSSQLDVSPKLVVSSDGSGVYHFVITEVTTVRFSMKASVDGIEPLCLVVLCLKNECHSQIYPFSALGKKSLRVRKPIKLSAGDYILCVPSIQQRQ